jgi:phospholipase/carboxylesterase
VSARAGAARHSPLAIRALPLTLRRMLNGVRIAARTEGPAPLLVVLHGLGDTSAGWEWLPGELHLPWLEYLMLDAPDAYFDGRSWFGISLPMDGRFTGELPAIDAVAVERSRAAIEAVLAREKAGGRTARDIAILGFSQGCLMAMETGLRHAEPLGGVVGISGWVHRPGALTSEAPAHARSVPVLMTHGTFDPLLGIEHVRPQAGALRDAGFDLLWQEFEKEHTVAGRTEVQYIARFLEQCFGREHARRRAGAGTAPD